jgi:hypothetical protein
MKQYVIKEDHTTTIIKYDNVIAYGINKEKGALRNLSISFQLKNVKYSFSKEVEKDKLDEVYNFYVDALLKFDEQPKNILEIDFL